MRMIGIALWALGIVIFVYAGFIFDASLQPVASSDRIVNLGRPQTQLLIAMAGLTLFLAGVIVHALSSIATRGDR